MNNFCIDSVRLFKCIFKDIVDIFVKNQENNLMCNDYIYSINLFKCKIYFIDINH